MSMKSLGKLANIYELKQRCLKQNMNREGGDTCA